jgi:hypothetical protein
VREIRTLNSLQKADTGYIVKFKVRVDDNAIEGTNIIKLNYMADDVSETIEEFDINIQTVDATIGIVSVETTPETVKPGETFDLKIKVRNLADSLIKDISLKLDLMLESVTVGAATQTTKSQILDAVPFAPTTSATEKKVKNMKPGEEIIYTYNLIAYYDASAKVYKVPIQLTYYDELGAMYSKNDVVGIVVSTDPDLSVLLDETTITGSPQIGEITVKYVNKGMTDIKFLNVMIKDTEFIENLGPYEVYIGNIESDDYETADFEVFVKSNNESKLLVPIHYEYMDANNNKFTEDVVLELKIGSRKEAESASLNGGVNPWVIGIGAVVIIVVIFLIIRAIRKKKKKE